MPGPGAIANDRADAPGFDTVSVEEVVSLLDFLIVDIDLPPELPPLSKTRTLVVDLREDMVQYKGKERTMPQPYPPKFQFQIVLELLQGEGQPVQSHNVRPDSILRWKKNLPENEPRDGGIFL